MSDTPETDKQAVGVIGWYSCATVPADFARGLERERNEARKLARWFYTRLKQVSLDHPLEGNVGGILARLEEAVLDDPWLEAAK